MSCNVCELYLKHFSKPKEKLGRCYFCIIASVVGTIIGWGLFILLLEINANLYFLWILFSITCFFTLLLLVHIIAYFKRKSKIHK